MLVFRLRILSALVSTLFREIYVLVLGVRCHNVFHDKYDLRWAKRDLWWWGHQSGPSQDLVRSQWGFSFLSVISGCSDVFGSSKYSQSTLLVPKVSTCISKDIAPNDDYSSSKSSTSWRLSRWPWSRQCPFPNNGWRELCTQSDQPSQRACYQARARGVDQVITLYYLIYSFDLNRYLLFSRVVM